MAISNHERVGKALDQLRAGLAPFIERELKAKYGLGWAHAALEVLQSKMGVWQGRSNAEELDTQALLVLMWDLWNEVFRNILGHAERTLVSELREVRNRWAHQSPFTTDDAYRALDSVGHLLAAVSDPEGEEVERMRQELLRVRFDEQARTECRKAAGTLIETQAAGTLKPWHEVISPHRDAASDKYQFWWTVPTPDGREVVILLVGRPRPLSGCPPLGSQPAWGYLCVAILVRVTRQASAKVLEGRVVRVAEDDTLTVVVDQRQERIRLAAIDAPE